MNVLILGLGRMGERYVQTLPNVVDCDICFYTVDPEKEVGFSTNHYRCLNDVPKIDFDLAIDARPNINRLETLEALIARDIPKIVVEKPTAQSLSESEKMVTLSKQCSSYVMAPFYRRFSHLIDPNQFKKLDAGSLQFINITAGAIGLGCNGVHFLDAANFLFGENPISVFAQVEEDSIISPRGKQFKDHSGTLSVNYSNNRRCVLSILPCSSAGTSTQFYFEKGKIISHEQKSPDWYWYSTPEESRNLPIYLTHTDQSVSTPEAYSLNLLELMEKGLRTFLEFPEDVPTLQDAHVTLATIALGVQSSRSGSLMEYANTHQIKNIHFNFT